MMYADSILAAYDEFVAAQAVAAEEEIEISVFADDELDEDDEPRLTIAPPRRHDSTASDASSTLDTPVQEGYVV